MTSKRKRQRKVRAVTAGATVGVGLAGVAGAFLLKRRGSGDGAQAPPATSASVDDSLRGHSADPAQVPAPVRPPTAGPVAPDTAAGEAPEGVAMPDTSADDPLVERETQAAAAQAGAIGGEADATAADAPARPVVEGSGDAAETFEATNTQAETDREKPA